MGGGSVKKGNDFLTNEGKRVSDFLEESDRDQNQNGAPDFLFVSLYNHHTRGNSKKADAPPPT